MARDILIFSETFPTSFLQWPVIPEGDDGDGEEDYGATADEGVEYHEYCLMVSLWALSGHKVQIKKKVNSLMTPQRQRLYHRLFTNLMSKNETLMLTIFIPKMAEMSV